MNNYNNNNYDNVYDGAFQQNKNLQRINEINRNQINDRFTPNRNLQNYFLSNQTPNDNNFKDYNNMGFNQKSYLNSPYSRYDNIKDFFSNNFTVNNTNNIFNNINFPYLNQNNIQNSNLRAIQILRSLISKNKTLKLLMPSKPINFNNDYNNNNIPRELCDANCNYNLWVEKFKKYLSTKLLEDLLFQHNNNLFTLNQLLEFTGIQVLSIIPEVEPGNFYEILQEQLEENFINNLNINNNNLGLKPNNFGLGNIDNFNKNSNFNIFNKENNNEGKKKIKIFFGDIERLKIIIQYIDTKLKNQQIKKLTMDSMYFERKERENLLFKNNDDYIIDIQKKTNPFINDNLMLDFQRNKYNNLLNKNKFILGENLMNLKKCLIQRLYLNEILFPQRFIKPITEKHSQIVIEYVVNRLRELKVNINLFKNNSGGKFFGENWCNIFPTDSQLIAYICIFYLEMAYKDSNIYNNFRFLISYPIPPILDKNSNNLYIYQSNSPEIEPYFCIIFKDTIIPCIDFFQCFVVYLFLLKLKNEKLIENMNLSEFIKQIITE